LEARAQEFLLPQQANLEIQQPTPISPRPMQLHLQTNNLWDDTMPQANSDMWNYPLSPACLSDMGPELDPNWPKYASDVESDYISGISRAHTFPQQMPMDMDSQELFSPIPHIQITSHDASPMNSPMLQPAFDLPIRNLQEELPPLQVPTSTPMDYYSDYLSPTDQPPTTSRRSSVSFGNNNNSSSSHVADWTRNTASTKRRHTTCSLTNPRTIENSELSWMLNSPRTTSYLKHYMNIIHPLYPFLPNSSHGAQPLPSDTSPFAETTQGIDTYQRLLTAAIGALQQHRSRDISARYVRHAMALQRAQNFELFASISGIHGAMLLVIYLLREEMDVSAPEEEDTSHPDVNLWLWSCRIAAACIDLGLHCWPQHDAADSDDDEVDHEQQQQQQQRQQRPLAALCMNTFRSAWRLDQEISTRRRRPRALHDGDIEPRMLAWVEGEHDEGF